MTSRLDGQSSALRGHTNAKLFLNKCFAARFGQLCNLEYATSIMLVACSPDLVILNRLCASAMGHLSFTPGHDSPSIVDPDLGRRQATMEDYHNLARLAHALPDQDLSGPLVAVPGDRSARTSHLLMWQASMTHSSKPLIGSTAGARGAQHTMEMASILFDEGIGERPLTIGLTNTLSTLSYSSEMLEALLVYATHRHPGLWPAGGLGIRRCPGPRLRRWSH